MEYFSEKNSSKVVQSKFDKCENPRLKKIMQSAVHHLHAFIKDVELTQDEWAYAINFLTNIGQKCDDKRQEFILLSDVLGVSMLVDAINNRKSVNATESTVLGPFYFESPKRNLGDNINLEGKGEDSYIYGRVSDINGNPIIGAKVDVWQANDAGFYDVQQPDIQPDMNLRGLFQTDLAGKYWFRSVKPKHYSIPTDGPVGLMLASTGRHPYRPAHLHYIVSAEGYKSVTTHVFVKGSEYLDSDAVFGVKDSLISEYIEINNIEKAKSLEFKNPFYELEFNFVLDKKK
ncbi:MAG: 6-chlorohydroxyquinol-1,2-dioxygenase [Alphaproteobacteria bacterium TMED87]|nr:MAG: 6-chlorohydroxyquinol-1,2-dioxygenase [Alphaproteobacteria bacterium TMED87]|tara:strand:+ start:3808 stop:4671 length:864 start_codon:yes stop_codon:yes gene_type:complete